MGEAVGQAVEQAVGQAVEQAVGQAVGQAVEQAVGQAVEQAVGQAVGGQQLPAEFVQHLLQEEGGSIYSRQRREESISFRRRKDRLRRDLISSRQSVGII